MQPSYHIIAEFGKENDRAIFLLWYNEWTMKVMTWNIWGGKHLDGVIDLIRRESPDIIALQEATLREGINTAEVIGDMLGYNVQFCETFTTDRHTPPYTLGNAILSKLPYAQTSCTFLSTKDQYEGSAATEPRNAAIATISVGNKHLTIIGTHLGFSEKWRESSFRQSQLHNLLKLIPENNCILMGDFNALPASTVVNKLSSVLVNTDPLMTQSSMTDLKDEQKTQYRIDYIFVSKDVGFTDFKIIETDASDHRPLVAIIL